ncbi:MAG TPA: TonB-dependent receptor [Candidatus Acidoferrales bacterium]|nr:TonB-dependent receptor [Candidatus Acidoferrales bacterium]
MSNLIALRGFSRRKVRGRIAMSLGIAALVVPSFIVTPTIAAANSNIGGNVRDAQTHEPLPGANVILVGTSIGASSDLNGRYVIRDVPSGTYLLRATYIGYRSLEQRVEVNENANVPLDFALEPVGVQGQTVVVTAQASGQNAAINQQLSSTRITNVVSAAKIQELPDANAAESVGRLPGIFLVREGGEATQVIIRGLAPKYNQIMIDGVEMAPTDAGDRGTDLSMISSSMVEGIEVTKAITPDMDAAVLGGIVNFDLREAQPNESGHWLNLLAQDSYDNLENTYGDYKVVGSIEHRFLEQRLGVFAEVDIEKRNLTSNELGAGYSHNAPSLDKPFPIYLSSLNLNDVLRDRNRYGGTVTLDYKLPDGKIDLMNFFSSSETKIQNRGESYGLYTSDYHSYSITDSRNLLGVITNLVEFENSFPLFTVDAKLSHSYSENRDPDDLSANFFQNNVGLNHQNYWTLNPQLIPPLSKDSLAATFFQGFSNSDNFARDRAITGSLDFQSNINFSNEITSTLKFGGKFQYRERSYYYHEADGALIVSGSDIGKAILAAFPWMAPSVSNPEYLPITLFEDSSFKYGKFLGGDYPMKVPVNINLMRQVLSLVENYALTHNISDSWAPNAVQSATNNYSGHEDESAAYVMVTTNFGQQFSLVPGVRYQVLQTTYTAPRGVEQGVSSRTYAYTDTTMVESHGFWLPMVHLIYRPLTWLQAHLAYTNTLTYPDYNTITPRIDVPTGGGTIVWNNYALKPASSANYDAVLSFYDNSIGLFSVDGFLKHIDNLIFPTGTRYVIDPAQYPGIPSSSAGAAISTYINNPYPVNLWGVEVDWQTHFWYLPDPLSGLVFSFNYTHIFSGAKYPRTVVNTQYLNVPPYVITTYDNTFYSDRLIDQPNDVVNVEAGYDYKGFSTRVSVISQSNDFVGQSFYPPENVNTTEYLRWDLSMKQDLPWFGTQIFFDLNNINSAREVSVLQGTGFPEAEQHYGMTADIGVRWKL